eukprot:Hpha_TRINITY_DN16636_c3_g10::TRINITY_DN16636_c3_g10_i1::g.182113::m.182113
MEETFEYDGSPGGEAYYTPREPQVPEPVSARDAHEDTLTPSPGRAPSPRGATTTPRDVKYEREGRTPEGSDGRSPKRGGRTPEGSDSPREFYEAEEAPDTAGYALTGQLSPRARASACGEWCMSAVHFLTDGPQEDRRLKKTEKDEEYVLMLDSRKDSSTLMQGFPDKVLMTMAFCPDGDGDSEFESIDVQDVDRIYSVIDKDGNGKLSKSEFLNALAPGHSGPSRWLESFLRSRQSALRLLLNVPLVSKVWDLFCGPEREVPREKFPSFIQLLKRKALTSLEAAEHMRGRAFWGYGQDKTPTPFAFWDEYDRLQLEGYREEDQEVMREAGHTVKQFHLDFHYEIKTVCGKIKVMAKTPWKGWKEDLWYYLCQNHHLLSLYFSDVDHPMSERERLVIEALLWGYTFLMTTAHNWIAAGGLGDWLAVAGCNDGEGLAVCEGMGAIWESGSWPLLWRPFGGFYAFFFVSIPVLILYRILFALHLCPCAFGGAGEADEEDAQCVKGIRKHMTLLGTIVGFLSLGLCVAFWFFGVILGGSWVLNGPQAAMMVLTLRLHAYTLQFLLILAMEFCPLPMPVEQLYETTEGAVYNQSAWLMGSLWLWQRERWQVHRRWTEIDDDDVGSFNIELADPPQMQQSGYGAA